MVAVVVLEAVVTDKKTIIIKSLFINIIHNNCTNFAYFKYTERR